MEDLIRMLRMMSTDGTEYNYQGQVAQANDAVLTREMINRMILQLDPGYSRDSQTNQSSL